LRHKCRKWIETLALEAETAVSNLDVTEQNYYRLAVARNIKDISQKDNITNKNKEEWKLLKNIKNKMVMNNNNNKSKHRKNTSDTYTRRIQTQNK
jgi:hypothetical protein